MYGWKFLDSANQQYQFQDLILFDAWLLFFTSFWRPYLMFNLWQSLRQMENENAKILNAKGELSEENSSSYEKLRKSYDHLYRNVSS